MYQSPEFYKAVMADRDREIQKAQRIRDARRATRREETTPRRRRWLRLRDPLRA